MSIIIKFVEKIVLLITCCIKECDLFWQQNPPLRFTLFLHGLKPTKTIYFGDTLKALLKYNE